MTIVTVRGSAPTHTSLRRRPKDWLLNEILEVSSQLGLPAPAASISMTAYDLATILLPLIKQLNGQADRDEKAEQVDMLKAVALEVIGFPIDEAVVTSLLEAIDRHGFEIRRKGW